MDDRESGGIHCECKRNGAEHVGAATNPNRLKAPKRETETEAQRERQRDNDRNRKREREIQRNITREIPGETRGHTWNEPWANTQQYRKKQWHM